MSAAYSILECWTDGACPNNGYDGARAGIGVFFGDNDPRNRSLPLMAGQQTNQRAELAAVFTALGLAATEYPIPDKIIVYTDSNYCVKALTEWYVAWENNGWTTSKNTPVLNQDIIRPLLQIQRSLPKVRYLHVRAHKKKPSDPEEHRIWYGNKMADVLAVTGATK